MTDTTTVDLEAWLTRIWDEEERLAKSGDWGVRSGSKLWVQTISSPGIAPGICASPQHVLARIAADRKILARCSAHLPPTRDWHLLSDVAMALAVLAEATIRDLASPYKGREGWQEEWGHE